MFLKFRKKFELAARLPMPVTFLVFVDVIFLFLIISDESFRLPCELKLWSGNILYALHAQLIGTRSWAMTILYNRDLRNKFFWAVKPRFFFLLAAFGITYTIFHTAFTQEFYLKTLDTRDTKCNFLLPWWNYLCVFSSILPLRFLWYLKIEKKKKTQMINDSFGIYKEVELLKYCEICVLVYVVYSQLCENERLVQKFPPILLLLLGLFLVTVVVVTLPSMRVLFVKIGKVLCISHQPRRTILTRVIPAQRERCSVSITNLEINRVLKVLEDEIASKKFREHALKHWCAENVDFWLEVSQYKRMCDPENIIDSADLNFQKCYTRFEAIVEEFVRDGAPCEINLSGHQKAAILEVRNLQIYQELGTSRSAIFDEAQNEIVNLLKENLLGSFNEG